MTDPHTALPPRRAGTLAPPLETAAAYGLAALFGALLAARIFPLAALDGAVTLAHPVGGDMAQHIVGQRYFLADGWHWPLLTTQLIDPPRGVNIAMTDSIPLAALAGRLGAGLLPPGGHLVYGWVALCLLLQPVAGVLALRAAGVRGIAAPVAGGIIAACMPALMFRFGHPALCTHFTLLLAIALYFRMVAWPRLWLWLPGTLLMLASLLIHPYLMAMVVAILAAAPFSLLAHGRRQAALQFALCFVTGLSVLLTAAALGGYLGAGEAPGFGYYSLNLLEPFVPAESSLFPSSAMPDATGGQYEGFSYLGAGLMGLAAAALVALRRRAAWAWLWGHCGLLLVAAAAFAFALSDRVYAGSHLLVDLPLYPAALKQFRASARFVWIDLYVLAVVAATLIARFMGRRSAACVLLVAAMVQFADTRGLRGQIARQVRGTPDWVVDPAIYRPLMASHHALTVWPTAACNTELVSNPAFMQLLLLSSEVGLPVNTIPVARTGGSLPCDPSVLTRPLAPGELRLVLPGNSPNLVTMAAGLDEWCHTLQAGIVGCATDASLDGQPLAGRPPFLIGTAMSLGEPAGALLTGLGWTEASVWGAWTIGRRATLLGVVPPGAGPLRLSVEGHGLAPIGQAQSVQVQANGQAVATWAVRQGTDTTYQADLPSGIASKGELALTLDIAAPIAPSDVLGSSDLRPLGFFLHSFRLDPA